MSSPTALKIWLPSALRILLMTGPGPDAGGSNNRKGRPHVPDKSGVDAVVCGAGFEVDAASCARADVADAAAAHAINNKSRAAFMLLT